MTTSLPHLPMSTSQFNNRSVALLTDLYEITMANGYFEEGCADTIVTFDVFYRQNPDNGGFSVFAGLEQIADYIKELHFSDDDIAYLETLGLFSTKFLDYLRNFRFTGDIDAVPEGTIVYPNEPLITVTAPIIEAQLIETFLLTQVNHQSLIATKANRIVRAAQGRSVADMGARRAHNIDAAVYGARAAYIGGVGSTATALAGKQFGIPVVGTMAHSWIMFFDGEYDAFKRYAEIYGSSSVFLVDTYDTLKSGVPTAIRVAQEVLIPRGQRLLGVRIDSGDMAYLSKKSPTKYCGRAWLPTVWTNAPSRRSSPKEAVSTATGWANASSRLTATPNLEPSINWQPSNKERPSCPKSNSRKMWVRSPIPDANAFTAFTRTKVTPSPISSLATPRRSPMVRLSNTLLLKSRGRFAPSSTVHSANFSSRCSATESRWPNFLRSKKFALTFVANWTKRYGKRNSGSRTHTSTTSI